MATRRPAPQGAGATVSVDPAAIRRQAGRAFAHGGYDDEWLAARAAADALADVIEVADRYAAAGQWANARVTYSTIAAEALAHYDEVDDETGELGAAILDCAAGLGACLEAQAALPPADQLPPPERAALFATLYAIWQHELSDGGGDLAVDVPALAARTATPAEKATLSAQLRAELGPSTGADTSATWGRRERVQFLLALQGPDAPSAEGVLAEYRQAGLYQDVAAQLLALGQVEAAIQVARAQLTTPAHVTAFADRLLERGAAGRAEALALVEARLQAAEAAGPPRRPAAGARDAASYQREQEIAHYRGWLEQRYTEFQMPGPALATARRRFAAAPDSRTYESVKQAAALPGQPADAWADLRPQLIATLEARRAWAELIVIYLAENAIDAALAALTTLQTEPGPAGWGHVYMGGFHCDLQLQVARAAEQDYPQEAIAIYQRVAERIIDARDRPNYAQAATHLARVQALQARAGQAAAWQTYIGDLRARNKNLRALIPELDSRGLR